MLTTLSSKDNIFSMQSREKRLRDICRQFHVATLYVFGSRALEAAEFAAAEMSAFSTGPSDLDVGVRLIPKNRLSVKDKVELTLVLEDFFSINKVDLVMLSEADPFLAANIIRGERLYARDEFEADEYDLYILRRAGDCIPLEREKMELILGGKE